MTSEIIWWSALAFLANTVAGAVVWVLIDDKDQRLYRWYCECPSQIAFFAQPLVLNAWPLGFSLWCLGKLKGGA